MIKKIKPWEYIVANNLNYLSGRVVSLLTEYSQTKDVRLIEEAYRDLSQLIERERFMKERADAHCDRGEFAE